MKSPVTKVSMVDRHGWRGHFVSSGASRKVGDWMATQNGKKCWKHRVTQCLYPCHTPNKRGRPAKDARTGYAARVSLSINFRMR